ncbi:transport and Golgi organization protein 1 isoform X2 [Prorops nasuta]|uniref:transport and Golgi organization protein 1 isoform X2 n=1 Tax=Prorops nasuta TaxID=863751 RepID=UPI0034CECF7D
MTKINLFIKCICLIVFVFVNGSKCSSQTSFVIQCYDKNCSVPIAEGRTNMVYHKHQPFILSFNVGAKVKIYGRKQDNPYKDYLAAEINEEFGFVPKNMVIESKVLKRDLKPVTSSHFHEIINRYFEKNKTLSSSENSEENLTNIDDQVSANLKSDLLRNNKENELKEMEKQTNTLIFNNLNSSAQTIHEQNMLKIEEPPISQKKETIDEVSKENEIEFSGSTLEENLNGASKMTKAENETQTYHEESLGTEALNISNNLINNTLVSAEINDTNILPVNGEQNDLNNINYVDGTVNIYQPTANENTTPTPAILTFETQSDNKSQTDPAFKSPLVNMLGHKKHNSEENMMKESPLSSDMNKAEEHYNETYINESKFNTESMQLSNIENKIETKNINVAHDDEQREIQNINTENNAVNTENEINLSGQSKVKENSILDTENNMNINKQNKVTENNAVNNENNVNTNEQRKVMENNALNTESKISENEQKKVLENSALNTENTVNENEQNEVTKNGGLNTEDIINENEKSKITEDKSLETDSTINENKEALLNENTINENEQNEVIKTRVLNTEGITNENGHSKITEDEVLKTDDTVNENKEALFDGNTINESSKITDDTSFRELNAEFSSNTETFNFNQNENEVTDFQIKHDELANPTNSKINEDLPQNNEQLNNKEILSASLDTCTAEHDCPKIIETDQHNFIEHEENSVGHIVNIGRNYWESFMYVSLTAVTILLFSLGYYYIENIKRDKQLISKINKLEKELLISVKECAMLQENFKVTKDKLISIEDESFGSNEMVLSLKAELLSSQNAKDDLEEQVATLEKDLESATEAGLELEKMLREVLSSNNEVNPIAQSIEDLQSRLNAQQAVNESLICDLKYKTQENEALTTELNSVKFKCEKLEDEINRINDEYKAELNSKDNWEQQLVAKVESLQTKVNELSTNKSNLTKELKEREIEIKDLIEVIKEFNSNSLDINKLYDVSHIKAEAIQLLQERDDLKIKLSEVEGAHSLLEEHMKLIQEEMGSLTDQCKLAEKEKKDAEVRLEVLSNFFKEKEAQRQKEEALWLQKQGEVMSTVERLQTLQNELQNYKQQIELLKREIIDQEREYKGQISTLEMKVHEHWLAARQNERRLEESKVEAGQLRNRLTLVEKNMNDVDSEAKIHRRKRFSKVRQFWSTMEGGNNPK